MLKPTTTAIQPKREFEKKKKTYNSYISLLTASLSIVYSFAITMSARKTRKEKVIAQLRRKLAQTDELTSTNVTPSTYSMNSYTFSQPKRDAITTETHAYLRNDLFKTVVFTGLVIVIELTLFFLTKNKLIKIPIIGF